MAIFLLLELLTSNNAGSINGHRRHRTPGQYGDNRCLLRIVSKQAPGHYVLKANNPDYEDLPADDSMHAPRPTQASYRPVRFSHRTVIHARGHTQPVRGGVQPRKQRTGKQLHSSVKSWFGGDKEKNISQSTKTETKAADTAAVKDSIVPAIDSTNLTQEKDSFQIAFDNRRNYNVFIGEEEISRRHSTTMFTKILRKT